MGASDVRLPNVASATEDTGVNVACASPRGDRANATLSPFLSPNALRMEIGTVTCPLRVTWVTS